MQEDDKFAKTRFHQFDNAGFYKMSETIIRGERYVLRRGRFREVPLGDGEWKLLETILDVQLPLDVRENITIYANLYALIGPQYSYSNTVLASDITPALATWLASTSSLLGLLNAKPTRISSKANFLTKFHNEKTAQRITRALPLEFLVYALRSAASVGTFVLTKLTNSTRNMPIQCDLWSAWVCLTSIELEKAGVKLSGPSIDKSHDLIPSRFIHAIIELQKLLPKECQHFEGYESVRKGTQQSRRGMGGMEKEALVHLLAGWGAQLHAGYPGNLRQSSSEAIQQFESLSKTIRTILIDRRHRQIQSEIQLRQDEGGPQQSQEDRTSR